MNNSFTEKAKLLLLGVVAALLLVSLLKPQPQNAIGADYGVNSGQAGSMTAIGISMRNDNSGLYVIDSTTPSIAYYHYENNKLQFRAARYIGYDLQLDEFTDSKGIAVADAKKRFESQSKRR